MSPFAAMWLCATVLSSSKASLNKSFPKSALRGHGFGGGLGSIRVPACGVRRLAEEGFPAGRSGSCRTGTRALPRGLGPANISETSYKNRSISNSSCFVPDGVLMIIPNGSAAVFRSSFVWTFGISTSCSRQALELSPEKVAVIRLPCAARSTARHPSAWGWIHGSSPPVWMTPGSLPGCRRRVHRREVIERASAA